MRQIGLIVLGLVCIFLQVSLLPALRPFGVVPNLVLGLVILLGLESTASLALIMAVAAGVVLDLAAGANFGLWTGTLVVAALVTGLIHRAGIELQGATVAMIMVAAGTLVMAVAMWLGVAGSVSGWPLGWRIGKLGVELGLNLARVAALRPVVRAVVGQAPGGEELRRVG
jgi:hypothetical protein